MLPFPTTRQTLQEMLIEDEEEDFWDSAEPAPAQERATADPSDVVDDRGYYSQDVIDEAKRTAAHLVGAGSGEEKFEGMEHEPSHVQDQQELARHENEGKTEDSEVIGVRVASGAV